MARDALPAAAAHPMGVATGFHVLADGSELLHTLDAEYSEPAQGLRYWRIAEVLPQFRPQHLVDARVLLTRR